MNSFKQRGVLGLEIKCGFCYFDIQTWASAVDSEALLWLEAGAHAVRKIYSAMGIVAGLVPGEGALGRR